MSLSKVLSLLLSSTAVSASLVSVAGLLLLPPDSATPVELPPEVIHAEAADDATASQSGKHRLGAGLPGLRSEAAPSLGPASSPAFVGVILPEQAADISAPQAGVVEEVAVALGEIVQPGQVLVRLSVEQAELDHRRAQAQRAAARAVLARSRIEQQHAQQSARRSELLASEGLATAEELARARFKLNESRVLAAEAEARLRERSAHAQQLAVVRDQARVHSSFRGRVAMRYVDAGTRVAAGTPLLRLISDGALVLRFAVPEHAATLQAGDALRVVPREHPEAAFDAKVVRAAPEIDAASRMRTFEAAPLAPAQVVEQGLVGALVSVRRATGGAR